MSHLSARLLLISLCGLLAACTRASSCPEKPLWSTHAPGGHAVATVIQRNCPEAEPAYVVRLPSGSLLGGGEDVATLAKPPVELIWIDAKTLRLKLASGSQPEGARLQIGDIAVEYR